MKTLQPALLPKRHARLLYVPLGNPTLLREQARATWSWHWLEVSARDLRYGTRRLLRSPGFACIAILVMALGIGAATSLFTMVRSVLLKPLPFRDPDKLVTVYEHFRGNISGDGLNLVSPADFRDWRAQTHGFEDMGAWRPTDFNLSGEHSELPEVIEGAGFSFSLLTVLGVEPVIGRNFTAQEDEPDANHVVLLTWSIFQRRFGGNPSIVGTQIHLNTEPWTIIGVLPSWFVYPDARSQIIVPWGQTYTPEQFSHHDMHQTHVVARMRPGASAVAAVKEIGALQYQLHLQHASEPVAEEVRWRPMLRLVLFDGLKTVIIGLLLGISGGLAAGAIIRSQLYGTSPYDPLVFISMVFSLLLTAVVACAVPAIRASRIDPMQALRAE